VSASAERCGIVAGGNWLVDHVKLIDRWPPQDTLAIISGQWSSNGGAPYNVLKDLARLGAPFPLEAIGLVGDDEAGRAIRDDCARHCIDAAQLHVTRTAPTSYTDVMTVQGSGRRTFFHCRGANAELGPEHFDFARTRARIFHFGYLLLLDRLDAPVLGGNVPAAVDVFRAARASGLKTSMDLVSEPSDRFTTIVRPVLPWVDWLFANEFEVERLAGIATAPNVAIDRDAVARAAAALITDGVREWVFVHFPAGVFACNTRGETLWQPSLCVPDTKIKGAAGAGDALASGILHALHEGWAMADALRLGVCAAAASLTHPTCSEGVLPIADCLALAAEYGFRDA
jgi:sugar/nucleoside kinase (ribokinase family)